MPIISMTYTAQEIADYFKNKVVAENKVAAENVKVRFVVEPGCPEDPREPSLPYLSRVVVEIN